MRIKSLDGLRGLAALIVLTFHLITVCKYNLWGMVQNTIVLRPLVAGTNCVSLFFILSGFVLHKSLSGKNQTYGLYLISRIFRLLPVHFFIFIFAAPTAYYFAGYISPIMAVRGDCGWCEANPLEHLFRQGVLLLPMHDFYVNHPTWSLAVELKVSLIMPIISYMIYKGFVENAILIVIQICFIFVNVLT